jgi:hypothetical protein
MKVLAPIGGVLEWRVEEGAAVSEGATLGWIAGPGRCGLVPLVAGASGLLRWRRSSALESIEAAAPAALIGGDEDEFEFCRAAEREVAAGVLALLEREIAELARDEWAHPLGAQLLRPQRRGLEGRVAALRGLSLRLAGSAPHPDPVPAGAGRGEGGR